MKVVLSLFRLEVIILAQFHLSCLTDTLRGQGLVINVLNLVINTEAELCIDWGENRC